MKSARKAIDIRINREWWRFGIYFAGSHDWREMAFGVSLRTNWNRSTCTDDGVTVGTCHSVSVNVLWWHASLSVLV